MLKSFWQELKKRRVTRVAIAYLIIAWVVLQVADVLIGVTQLPDWSLTLVAVLLALGFVPTLIFAWVFGTSIVVWAIIKATMGIRVSEEEELSGVDIHECGLEAYPEFTNK